MLGGLTEALSRTSALKAEADKAEAKYAMEMENLRKSALDRYNEKNYKQLYDYYKDSPAWDVFKEAKKYTVEEFVEQKLHGIPLGTVLELLKEHYPEHFV